MDKITRNSDFLLPSLGTSSDAINRVFNLELIREKILDYAIHEKGIVETSNVKSYRLVSKAWHQSTSRILRKAREPLFRFGVSIQSFEKQGETKGETELNHFVKSVTEGVRLEDHVPPHSINVELCTSRFYQRLFECFVNCGSSLIELKLYLMYDGLNYDFLTTNVAFSKLRKLDITILGQDSKRSYYLGVIEFLQRILTSSDQLQSLRLNKGFALRDCAYAISNLILPPSITDIQLDDPEHSLIEMLVRNSLPNLKSLSFVESGYWTFRKEGIFTRLLQNVGKNLERFLVLYQDEDNGSASGTPTTFVLPLMEKLQIFFIGNMNLELEGYPLSLERYLPVLSELQLQDQTIAMLRKWVDTSCFHSVTSLTLSFRIERRPPVQLDDANPEHVESSTIRALNSAFPNLIKLDITFPTLNLQDPAVCRLWEMDNLTSLSVNIQDTPLISTPDLIDALLIGISLEDVPKLRSSPALWKDLKLRNVSSIRNLTNLEKLELKSYRFIIDILGPHHLLSDLTFEFAFFDMPKLKNLDLGPGFYASRKMENQWRKEGREIKSMFSGPESDSNDTETGSDWNDTETGSDSSGTETESRNALGYSSNDLQDSD